ncbi:sugar ABC transporter substrate-binding protein [Leucobacter coleopterorum]|uniref:Sugar ABC transporter substrate-binding protein n=1 Tax=Leucobacter coleopterorum TaxID=2714933 RepID=A0ABX6JTR9_9MICO|nr:sugar ABC transporter substrate-binding protein [Leucobacter coleopterorum]QIM17613.1 sugar ABC transporter substrate-binding protein [Leucobacter coleopterorum]
MRKKFLTAAVAAVGALALGLTGCSTSGNASEGGGEVKLTFWDHSGNPTRAKVYEKLIDQYEKENKGVTIEFLTLPSDSAFDKIQTSLASGSGPDIASLSGTFLAPLTAQEALVKLDDKVKGSELDGKIDPELVEVMRADARDGGLYALPYTFTNGILWYRTDLWKNAGYPDGITSWDDFYTGTVKLTDPAAGQQGFAMRGGAGGVFQFLQAMYAESGVDTLFDDKGVSTVDDPKNVEAFTKYTELYKKATSEADLGFGYPEMVAAFDSGAAATVQHNLGSFAEHEAAIPGKFAAAPLPESASGERVIVADPIPSFGIFKNSKNQEEAWKFMEFLLGTEANGELNKVIGQIPSNLDARGEAWLKDSQSVSSATEWVSGDNAVILTPPTHLPDYGTIMRTDMEPQLQRVLLGEMKPKEFLTTLADKLTTAQQKYLEETSK